jgi:Flp pilus assembly protein TadD
MNLLRALAVSVVVALAAGQTVHAQDDSARAFFSAYQEYQRAERFEREGQTAEAVAKFRFVVSQLSQMKEQHPDWQPLVVEFRLRKAQEAIVRLEGTLDSGTMGPPPDLAVTDGLEDVLPPVRPPRVDSGGAPPTISISPPHEDGPAEPLEPLIAPDPVVDTAEIEAARNQLAAEKTRTQDLEAKLTQSDAELSNVSMELEKTKVALVDLNTQLRQLKESGTEAKPSTDAAQAEIERLTALSKELEESLAAAQQEKADLTERATENTKQLEAITAELQTAKSETETAKVRVGELEQEREGLVAARDEALGKLTTAQSEAETAKARVNELEQEREGLVAARDEAQKQAAEAKTALEKSAELIEANRQLETKLAEAATKIAGMESDVTAKEEVITGLQADLDKVRTELAGAQTKLKDDRARFDQLQAVNDQLLKEYDDVNGALAAVKLGDVTAAEAKLIQQENEVLRGIIMRQIKEQARREQAYRLAQEEMERLEIRSDTLNDKINELAKPTLELTEAEQEMLKRPVVTLLDADAARMSAQVEVLKPKVPGMEADAQDTAASGETSATPAGQTSPEGEPASTASAAAESLSTEPSPEAMALIAEARDEFVKGNFAKAEQLYQKFLEKQPDSVVALANLGVAQFRQGKLTAAQLALEKAVKVDPTDAFTLTTLGAVMIEQGRIEDAITYLKRANDSVADDPITLNYLGVASSQIGQFGEAEKALRRAITVKPDYAEAHFNLAVIYATAKPPSIALAKRHYEKALELGAGPDKRLASLLQSSPGS